MRELVVTTWNLLHRVHGENWSEEAVARFPDEQARITQLTARIAAQVAAGRVVCLQEVSGDQLESVRRALPEGAHLFAHRHPRHPRLRSGEPAPLVDAAEHLAIAAHGYASAHVLASVAYANDPGKGLLFVELEPGLAVLTTHATPRDAGKVQLAKLRATAASFVGTVVVCGDFNATRAVVAHELGATYEPAALPAGGLPTRVAAGGHAGKDIDHVLVRDGRATSASVEDGAGLSDHNPVTATITCDAAPRAGA